ncbi:MAG: ribonuclease P protein component [Cyanobacteriota bacterium]
MVLPCPFRLRGRGVFDHLYRRGRSQSLATMVLKVAPPRPELLNPPQPQHATTCRLVVVVSSKVSKRAVVRNRLRRLFHEAFRQRQQRQPLPAAWLLLSLRPGAAESDPADLLKQWTHLLHLSGLLDDDEFPGIPERGRVL